MEYVYPRYGIDFTRETLDECRRAAVRLVSEEGMVVRHERFLDGIRGKPGVTIDSCRVRFDRSLIETTLDETIEKERKRLEGKPPRDPNADLWVVDTGGYSIAVIDPADDEVRPATQDDLRAFVRMVDSYELGGSYPVAPQDVPPLMRALAVFKICWETSARVRPWDYMDIRQIPFLYEMHRVMEKPFPIHICVPQPLGVDEHTLEYFVSMYDAWKKNGDCFLTAGDYPMLGVSKPITSTGCFTIMLANRLALHLLFKAFDPEVELGISASAGQATDLRSACWAWGSPRGHLYRYLDSRIWPRFCGVDPEMYAPTTVLLESSSCAADAQAAMEKMATCLLAALQGVRHFRGAGSLCVDDLYSPVQFVIDVEIVRYIREMIESFDPHADVLAADGLYEVCRDCVRGDEEFISHPDTVRRFRNILPSLGLIRREKLRSWLSHKELLVDRAREEAIERMNRPQTFHLPDDKQKELDRIYRRAEEDLAD